MQLTPDAKYVIVSVNEQAGGRGEEQHRAELHQRLGIRGRHSGAIERGRFAKRAIAWQSSAWETGDVKWVDHGQKVATSTTTDRDIRLSMPELWSEDGSKAVFQGRAADNKDRWVFALDAATGKTRVLATDHDNAWVGGPGANTLGWMKNGREVYFQSERTGYSQMYAVAFDVAAAAAGADFQGNGKCWMCGSRKISRSSI